MRRRLLVPMIAAASAAAVAAWFVGGRNSRGDVVRGAHLYAEHCASCHGKNLEGQPDWMKRLPGGRLPAPPHDASGHTWHHSDDELLVVTRDGMAAIVPGYDSDMPAFGDVLTDEEIAAVFAFIKSTWPERERAYQARRSEPR